MKLGFFAMPIHPIGRAYSQTLREDRELAILADQLGFVEGYFGEHFTDSAENITSSLIFVACCESVSSTVVVYISFVYMNSLYKDQQFLKIILYIFQVYQDERVHKTATSSTRQTFRNYIQ